jgi:hypothetical protein
MVLGKRALADLADAAGRAAGVDDEGVGHGLVLPDAEFSKRLRARP